jgi:hypothetical protein
VDCGDCVTVKVRPEMTTVPVRAASLFGATVKATGPGPVPSLCDKVNQFALLAAVHWHPALVVTAMDPLPPWPGAAYDAGAIVSSQPSDWDTMNRCPATRIVPLRAGPVAAATVKGIWDEPLPAALAPRTIQVTSLSAVHVHRLLEARTSTWPDPPA